MKNPDYVLRFEVLSGVSQAYKTNSHSSFIILHLEHVTPILHSSFFILHLTSPQYLKRNLIHTLNREDRVDNSLEFIKRVNGELETTRHYLILGDCMQFFDGKTELIGYAIREVIQQMLSIYCMNNDAYRIKHMIIRKIIHSYQPITFTCRQGNSIRTITTMHAYSAPRLLYSNYLFARNGITHRATVILRSWQTVKILIDRTQCLI